MQSRSGGARKLAPASRATRSSAARRVWLAATTAGNGQRGGAGLGQRAAGLFGQHIGHRRLKARAQIGAVLFVQTALRRDQIVALAQHGWVFSPES